MSTLVTPERSDQPLFKAGHDEGSNDHAPPMVHTASQQAEIVPYDDTLLEAARTQWQFGDWESLAALNIERIQHHPARARLALLAATGHFQRGDDNNAHRYLRLAMDWGASPRLVQQMLISGVHQCLGAAYDLLKNPDRARRHMQEALRTGGVPGDIQLLTRARMVWQTGGQNPWEEGRA